MSSSLPASSLSASSLPASVQATAHDLELLRRGQRRQAIGRAAIGTGFFLLGAAIAWPVVVTLPPRLLATAALAVLAAVGVRALYAAGAAWLRARYQLVLPDWRVWRWRLVRRWYAPGSVVWFADVPSCCSGPLVVLEWADDPACTAPWVLTYDGHPIHRHTIRTVVSSPATSRAVARPSGAGWCPVDWLSPTPVEPRPGQAHACPHRSA